MNREIKALMVLRGIRNKDIAKKAHVSETWVSLIVCGHRRSPRVRGVIADVLGRKIEELWPGENGKVA